MHLYPSYRKESKESKFQKNSPTKRVPGRNVSKSSPPRGPGAGLSGTRRKAGSGGASTSPGKRSPLRSKPRVGGRLRSSSRKALLPGNNTGRGGTTGRTTVLRGALKGTVGKPSPYTENLSKKYAVDGQRKRRPTTRDGRVSLSNGRQKFSRGPKKGAAGAATEDSPEAGGNGAEADPTANVPSAAAQEFVENLEDQDLPPTDPRVDAYIQELLSKESVKETSTTKREGKKAAAAAVGNGKDTGSLADAAKREFSPAPNATTTTTGRGSALDKSKLTPRPKPMTAGMRVGLGAPDRRGHKNHVGSPVYGGEPRESPVLLMGRPVFASDDASANLRRLGAKLGSPYMKQVRKVYSPVVLFLLNVVCAGSSMHCCAHYTFWWNRNPV